MYNWIISLIAVFLLNSFCVFGTDRVSTGTANWTVAGTWSPSGVPAAGDNITILTGHTVSVNTTTAVCTNVTINGTLGCNNNQKLSASGNLVMKNGSVAGIGGGTLNIAGTFSVTSGSSATIGNLILSVSGATTIDGTLTFNNTGGAKTFAAVTVNTGGSWTSSTNEAISIVGNVNTSGTFNCNSGTYTLTGNFSANAGTTNYEGSISGTLTVLSGATLNANSGNLSVSGLTTITGTVNITSTTGTKSFGGITVNSGGVWNSTVNEAVTVTGDVTNAGTFDCFSSTYAISGNFTASAGSTNYEGSIGGNLTISSGATFAAPTGILTVTGSTSVSGTITISTATGTHTFANVTIASGGVWNCTVAEAISISGSLANSGTFTSNTGAYTFSGSGKTFSGTLSISNVSVSGTYTNNATFTVGTALGGAGTLTQASGSTLNLGGTSTITTLVAAANANLVKYNGAGAQTVRGITYYNLTITSGNTATAGATFTCGNNLSLTSGTFASGSFTITVSGATTVSGGTLSTSNAAGAFNLQSLSLTGGAVAGLTGNVNVATTLSVPSGAPTIGRCNLTVTGATTIAGSLTFNSITGTKILGDVTVSGGGTWSSSVVLAFKINGNLSNSGTFTANTGVYTLAGTGKTISGTLSVPTFSVTGSYTNNATLTTATALQGAGTFTQGASGTLNIAATAANFSVTTFNASASGNTVNYNLAGVQSVKVPSDGSYHHLTVSGSNNKTLLGTTDINGDMTISTCTLVANNNNMTLGGNWLNTSGLFTPGTNTVTLDGAAQSITKSGGETFNHLVFSGTGTKTLGSAITTNGNLAINSTLDVSGSNFGVSVKGKWINNGTFASRSGTVTFNGAAAQTVGGTAQTNFYDITQSNAAGVSLAQSQNLYNALTISLGTFTATGFNFTLISDANGTARIATIPSGANIAGSIIMQRYSGTGPTDWRFLSSAVSGATIASWTDDFATSGFTGSTDPTSTYPSIYSYNEAVAGVADSGFVAATNVTNSISSGKGFWVYLGPNPSTIDVTGAPNTFTVTPTVTFTSNAGASHDGWNLIPNPYPSAVDWDAVGWTKTNMDNAVYVYNSSTGSYASYVAGVGVNGGSRYIASSQAFWVKANAASPVIKLVEGVKATTNPTHLIPAYHPNISPYPMAFKDFPVPLNVNKVPNSIKLTANGNGFDDETMIFFTQGATNGFDGASDAWKIENLNLVGPSLASVIDDTSDMAISGYPELNSDVTVPLRMLVPVTGTYSIRRDSLLMLPMSSCIILEDLATGNFTDLRANISYSFTISDTTSVPRFLLHIYAPVAKEAIPANCANDSSGMAIAKGTGSGPWNYVWKDEGGNVMQTTPNSSTADTLKNLALGVYTIEVSGSVCGTVQDTIEIKTSSTLAVTLNYFNVLCNGANNGSASANVVGGILPYTYSWSNGAGNATVNNLSPGTYSLTVKDAGGCSQMQAFTISQPQVLTAGFIASTDTVDLSTYNSLSCIDTSSGANSWLWDFGDATPLDTAQNPVHYYGYPGTYNVILVVSNGTCFDTTYGSVIVVDSLLTTGIANLNVPSSLQVIYENGEVFLAFDLLQKMDVKISIYNSFGEKVAVQYPKQVHKSRVKLHVEGLAAGMYVCIADLSNEIISRKIIIQKSTLH